jgi:hypothetical protein
MVTQVPEVKSAPTQPPGVIHGPRPPTGTSYRNLWIAVIVAVVLGALGGYFLRWGTESTKTVSKTVTDTVTETVAPPAFAGKNVTVHVRYDGTRCLYQGPGELRAGSTVHVKYSSRVPDSRFFMWWLGPSTTYGELMASHPASLSATRSVATFQVGGYSSFPIVSGSNPWTRLQAGDLVSFGCDPRDADVVHATMIRVAPS